MRAVRGVDAAAFLVSAVGTALLATDQGGFFPRTWFWAALAYAAVAALAAVAIDTLVTTPGGIVLVAGLAGLALWAGLSAAWSLDASHSLEETLRADVYVTAALALVLLAAAAAATAILLGVVAAASIAAAISLLDLLVSPDKPSLPLADPVGYANALGVLCAVGLVVLVALSLRSWPVRAAAAAAVAVAALLLVVLVLTQSRGSWAAALAGVAVAVAVRLGWRRAAAAVIVGAAVLLAAAYVMTAFTAPSRLQARGAYWNVAWRVVKDEPLRGTGAGTYDLAWAAWGDLSRWQGVLDAHSLYIETLAELGIVGLALLPALVAPLVEGLRASRPSASLVAGLGGGTTFLLHAGLDWDWEMPAVTIAGIACLVCSLDPARRPIRIGRRLRAAALAVAVSALCWYGVIELVRGRFT